MGRESDTMKTLFEVMPALSNKIAYVCRIHDPFTDIPKGHVVPMGRKKDVFAQMQSVLLETRSTYFTEHGMEIEAYCWHFTIATERNDVIGELAGYEVCTNDWPDS